MRMVKLFFKNILCVYDYKQENENIEWVDASVSMLVATALDKIWCVCNIALERMT